MITINSCAMKMSAINGNERVNNIRTIKNLLNKSGSTEISSFDYADGAITINGNQYAQNTRGHWSQVMGDHAPAPKSVTPQCADLCSQSAQICADPALSAVLRPVKRKAPLATLKRKAAGFFKPDKVVDTVNSDLTMLLDFTTIPSDQDYAAVQYQPRQFEVISGTAGMGVVVTNDTDPCTTQEPDFIESESEFVDYDTALIKYAGLLVDIGHDQEIADNTALLMIDLLRQSIADTEYQSTYKIESLVTMTVELNGETTRVIYDPRTKCFVPLEI